MEPGFASTQRTLRLHKLFRPFADHYEIRTPGGPVGYVHRERGKWQATAYTDESKQRTIFTLEDRLGLPAVVSDARDTPIGMIRRDGGFFQRTGWRIEQGDLEATAREASAVGAFFRSFGAPFSFLASTYAFTLDGQPAVTVRRRFGYRTRICADIADDRWDRRLIAAVLVELD
jgi:hypothetical protein